VYRVRVSVVGEGGGIVREIREVWGGEALVRWGGEEGGRERETAKLYDCQS
jgi:hypothetical protein